MADETSPHPYVTLARRTVERKLNGGPMLGGGIEIDPRPELWNLRRACFVSIKTTGGDLRGCIGTIVPMRSSIDLEIMENAISSSTRDPRFPPIKARELDRVVFSVDVLSEPEVVADINTLDASKWGVIVTKGPARGVLLPDLEGVDTVARQIEIAAAKAGIYDMRGVTIERFSVDRYPE